MHGRAAPRRQVPRALVAQRPSGGMVARDGARTARRRGDRSFRFVRARGHAGRQVTVIDLVQRDCRRRRSGEVIRVVLRDGTVHTHRPADWLAIELRRRRVRRSSIDLGGRVADRTIAMPRRPCRPPPACDHHARARRELRECRARRGALSALRADVDGRRRSDGAGDALRNEGRRSHLDVDVPKSDLTFVRAGAVNPFDNEPADINGDGVQLYLRNARAAERLDARARAPIPRSCARDRSRAWVRRSAVRAHVARRSTHGYRMRIERSAAFPTTLDVVDQRDAARARATARSARPERRAPASSSYLRGDRHEPRGHAPSPRDRWLIRCSRRRWS